MSEWASDTRDPKDCPDPSVHGNPFRYCPYCSWREEPAPKPGIANDAVQEALEGVESTPWQYATLTAALADREQLREERDDALRCRDLEHGAGRDNAERAMGALRERDEFATALNDPAFVRVPREVLEDERDTSPSGDEWAKCCKWLLREFGTPIDSHKVAPDATLREQNGAVQP